MTTIAFRDGIMAGDSLATKDGLVASYASKLVRLKDHRCAARIGNAASASEIIAWLDGGRKGPQPDGDGAVVVAGPEGLFVYEGGAVTKEGEAPFYAWGCGAPIAIGAMAAGATAEQAVKIACEWDTLTGGKVHILRLPA